MCSGAVKDATDDQLQELVGESFTSQEKDLRPVIGYIFSNGSLLIMKEPHKWGVLHRIGGNGLVATQLWDLATDAVEKVVNEPTRSTRDHTHPSPKRGEECFEMLETMLDCRLEIGSTKAFSASMEHETHSTPWIDLRRTDVSKVGRDSDAAWKSA